MSSASLVRFASAAALVVATVGCSSRDPRAVSALTPELEPVVKGNNTFALEIYKKAAANPGNLFFSPFSISAAFGMTLAGARGATADELRTALAIQGDEAAYHTQFGALLADLGGAHEGRGYELRIANRMFGQKDLAFQQAYLDLTSTAYAAPLDRVDYMVDHEAARGTINQWVSDQTEGHVPELFGSEDIDGLTRLAVANAIYFHADWTTQFDAANTHDGSFVRADGSTASARFMSETGAYRYGWSPDAAVVEMNYADDELSMVVVVPQGDNTLAQLEQGLDSAKLDSLLGSLEEQDEVSVMLPKFELDARLPLEDLLRGLGVNDAFDLGKADFSGVADAAAGDLYLQAAVHQAYIKVDESGTEAAAATGSSSGALSGPPEFRADRPFLFFIRDKLTTSILFAGRIEDPTGVSF